MSNNRGHGLGWGSSFNSVSSGRTRGRAGYACRGGRGGRGSRGGRGGSWQQSKPQNQPDTSLHPLGELMATLNNSFLDLAASSRCETASITDCQYVTSYSWLNMGTPTIMVPGKPPLWTPLDVPRPLDEDRGDYFRDPNAAKYPSYPTEPAVQALLSTDPKFPKSSVDVFACGSTMGNLLRFVRSIDKSFRFSVEAVDNTVFFIRKENDPAELIDGVRGYGHTFPENYTMWEKEVKGSESHQRVVQYYFGGFKCLVRFECDGYLGGSTTNKADANDGTDTGPDKEDLASALEAVSMTQHVHTTNDLTLKIGGSEVPQESIFDLKTRSGKYGKQIDMEDQLPSLWVKQIPNFVVAYHNGAGLFEKDKIQVRKVREDLQRWEADNTAALKRMTALIRKIIDFAKANDEHRIDIYCPSVDRLEIRKQIKDTSHVLPLSLRNEWTSKPTFAEQYSDSDEEEDDEDREDNVHRSDYGEFIMGNDSSDNVEEPDYTACSAEDCGYCGRCRY